MIPEARKRFYIQPDIERLFEKIHVPGAELAPKPDIEHGYRYPEAEEALGRVPQETSILLNELYEAKVLSRRVRMEIFCPNEKCGSPNVGTRYVCPHCNTDEVARKVYVEHVNCGMHFTVDGVVDGSSCKECGATLVQGNYRIINTRWLECTNCKDEKGNNLPIEIANPVYTCKKCGNEFSFDDAAYKPAAYKPVSTYFLADDARREVEDIVILFPSIRNLLSKYGFDPRGPETLTGKSGRKYTSDITAVKNDTGKIMVDILISREAVPDSEVMKEGNKIIDLKLSGAIREGYVIVLPELTEDGRGYVEFHLHNLVKEIDRADNPTVLTWMEENLKNLGVRKIEAVVESEGKSKPMILSRIKNIRKQKE